MNKTVSLEGPKDVVTAKACRKNRIKEKRRRVGINLSIGRGSVWVVRIWLSLGVKEA